MGLAEGIRKRGFRKWYERELMRGHAHMVLTLLCAIGLFATFEFHDRGAPWTQQLADLASVLLLAVVGAWSLRRYLYLLTHAESVANQAVCPHCKTYGRFSLTASDVAHQRLTVRCRKCEHEWPIDD